MKVLQLYSVLLAIVMSLSGQRKLPAQGRVTIAASAAQERLASLALNRESMGGGIPRTSEWTAVDWRPRGVLLWRFSVLARDYLVLQRDSTSPMLRGGGFQAPDLFAIADALGTSQECAAGWMAMADCLTVVLDPNGAGAVILPGHDDPHPESLQWRRARPRDWPPDTMTVWGDTTVVVRTALTQVLERYDQSWDAIGYAFVFVDRRLVAWSSRRKTP